MLLDEPIGWPAAATAPQIEAPARGARQSQMWWCGRPEGRYRADAPARHCGDRLAVERLEVAGAGRAANEKCRHAALLRRQLQPSALREVERCHFAHDRAEGRAAQGFLDRPQCIVVAPDLEMQQPVWVEPVRRQGAGVEITPPADPDDAAMAALPMQPADEAGDGGGGQGAFLKVLALAGEFMECAEHQPMAGQMLVDGGQSPGETRRCSALKSRLRQLLQQSHLPTQRNQPRRRFGQGWVGGWDGGLLAAHILFLFSCCGESSDENIKRTLWLTWVFALGILR